MLITGADPFVSLLSHATRSTLPSTNARPNLPRRGSFFPSPFPCPFLLADSSHLQGSDSAYSTDSAEESETESLPKGKLGKLSRRRFASLLRGLSGRRVDVARGMKFALDRGDAGDAVRLSSLFSLFALAEC